MINKKAYKEFYTSQEADNWGLEHFGSWNRDMRLNKNDVSQLLFNYAGNMSIIYNLFLRGYKDLTEEEVKEYSRDTYIIANEIRKFELKENIIVYRYTSNALFKLLFDTKKPNVGQVFEDKGFMSTTLVQNQLKDFAKTHNYNCLLKLYLPVGTKGVYIKFSLLNECEFLLPPNSKFRLIRKYWNLSFQRVYECELVN